MQMVLILVFLPLLSFASGLRELEVGAFMLSNNEII